MPAYSSSPVAPVPLALAGDAVYAWGSAKTDVSPTRMLIDHVAITTNVATLNVTVVEGNIPAVGDFITVTGTTTSSGVFNVTAVALTGVTINATTGIGTVTYALTNANIGSTANAGIAYVQYALNFETVSLNSVSQAIALAATSPGSGISNFSVEVSWAPGTSAGVATVQVADRNDDSLYASAGASATITWPATRLDVSNITANFVRLKLTTGLTGATTIAARVLLR